VPRKYHNQSQQPPQNNDVETLIAKNSIFITGIPVPLLSSWWRTATSFHSVTFSINDPQPRENRNRKTGFTISQSGLFFISQIKVPFLDRFMCWQSAQGIEIIIIFLHNSPRFASPRKNGVFVSLSTVRCSLSGEVFVMISRQSRPPTERGDITTCRR